MEEEPVESAVEEPEPPPPVAEESPPPPAAESSPPPQPSTPAEAGDAAETSPATDKEDAEEEEFDVVETRGKTLAADGRLELCQLSKLLQCVRARDVRMVDNLVSKGVPRLLDYAHPEDNETVLGLAASRNDDTLLEHLLELGADPNVADVTGRTAAMRACEYGHLQSMSILADAGIDMQLADDEGKGVLFYCIAPTKRHFQCAQIALQCGADCNNATSQGTPILTFASETAKGNEELCIALLDAGADAGAADEESNRTCAMAAASSGSARVLRAILDKKNIADELMMPIRMHALHEAAKNGHLEVIQVLAAFGANFDQATDKMYSTGNSPIHAAALAGKDNVVQLLASRGCNAMLKNKENKTARAIAKELGSKPVTKACKKAEKFSKAKTKPNPWLLALHDFCYVRDRQLFEVLSQHDTNQNGLIGSTEFLETMREAGVPEPEDPSAWDAVLANHTVDKKIQYNVLLGGRKIVPKKYHMASFEPKFKKGKKPKKVKVKKPPIPICLLPPVAVPDSFVPLHVDFTDFSRFDRDHPPIYPLQDDSAWYMERPEPTKVGLNIALRQLDRQTVANTVDDDERKAEMADAETQAAGAVVRHPPLGPDTQVNAVDTLFKSPLSVAAAMGNLELVKLLVEAGADVNAVDNFYWTPLHMAAHSGVRSVVEYLLDHGASLEATSLTRATPVMKAIETCNLDIVQLLINRGAKVRAEDMCTLTPLDIAACYADYHVYKTVNDKLQSLPPVKDKDKKKKPDKKAVVKLRHGADTYQRKMAAVVGTTTPTSVGRSSLASLPALPTHPLHERPSLLQATAGGGLSLATDNDDVGDIVYRPRQVWTSQPTTDQLVEARAERRRQYGWLVDFDDFQMPFNRNVRNRLEQQATALQQEMDMKRKTAKRKK